MKAQTMILLVIIAILLLSSVALAQSDGPPGYVVKPGTASGGAYRLTGVTWQVRGIASGGSYRLAGPVGPAGTGTPCCCNYLPCVIHKSP